MKRILSLLFVCLCCLPGYGTVVPNIDYVRTNIDKYSYRLDDAIDRICEGWKNSNQDSEEALVECVCCLNIVNQQLIRLSDRPNESSCFSSEDLALEDVWECGITKLFGIILKCMSDDSYKANALYERILDILDGPREKC